MPLLPKSLVLAVSLPPVHVPVEAPPVLLDSPRAVPAAHSFVVAQAPSSAPDDDFSPTLPLDFKQVYSALHVRVASLFRASPNWRCAMAN